MAIFSFLKKKTRAHGTKAAPPWRGAGAFKKSSGTSSKIAELRSPYMKKPTFTGKFFKRGRRKKSLVIPTIQPKILSKAKKILTFIVALAVASGLIYLVGFSGFFDIKSWEITEDGNKITNDEPLNDLMKKQKYKNLVFLDDKLITTQIKSLHPEVKKVIVKKIFPQKIKVEIEKYPIVANIVNVVQGIQKKFLVDTQGFLADENIENPELPFIKIFTNEVFTVRTIGLEENKLTYIMNSINLFQEKFAMKVINAEYHVREREIHLQTEKNFMVWIDMEKDLNEQMEKLKKALPKLNIYNTPLEYIDLRIAGNDNQKVIFKRRK
jgi:cell division septal protein FtsQ